MKKILKSKIFWIVITIIIIIGAFWARAAFKGTKVEYITSPVETGSVIQTVSATGKIKSASNIELNFKNTGKLTILNVKVGDQVKEGQILAQLKATDLAINVSKARADLEEAIANLDKLKAGATIQDIAVYQAAVEKIQTDLANSQSDLTSTKATYSQALENERQSILIDIDSVITKANISLQKVYDTLYHEGDANNFSTSNTGLQQQVNNGYNLSLIKVDEAELAYNVAKLDSVDEKIDQAVDKTLEAINKTADTLSDLSQLLDDVIVTSVLTQSELDTLKTTINTERTTTNTNISTIQTSKHDLADARLNYQTEVEAAENSVKAAEKNLIKAQADLELRKAPARVEDIALYQARVKKAQADLELTQDKYDETIIRAPISGVITDVNFEIGEQTNLSESVITMLATQNYEIEVDIPESDIVKINVGDETDITLDAFTADDIFKGVVTTINPAQTEIQDVIYYRVTVTFKAEQLESIMNLMDKIKPGMTANVSVNTARVDNVLVIPLRAVKEENGKKIVQILENNQPKTLEVELGLKGDEGTVEVKSGLTAGQQVITFVRNGGG